MKNGGLFVQKWSKMNQENGILKKAIIIYFSCTSFCLKAQEADSSASKKDHGFLFTSGLSIGNETVIGTGKMDLYKEFGNKQIVPYVGIGGSIYFFFAAWGSINTQAGFRYKNFTIDASVARWKYTPSPNEDGSVVPNFGPFSHTSFNPKIGFRTIKTKNDNIWIKIGPSFIFNQDNGDSKEQFSLIDILKIDGQSFNIEVSGILKF